MSGDLRFRRLRLRNWKNFLQVDVALQDRLFLEGANASGKSTVLDAFRLLRDIALSGSGFWEAVVHPRRGGVSGVRCLAARQYPDVEIAVQLEEEGDGAAWEYENCVPPGQAAPPSHPEGACEPWRGPAGR